ncbi:MAG TPA: hypothetical protein VM406_14110 [Noviherbaspirillum sp.]|nr:hypothetical protein [Noviherbaspirillum sp.]
MNTRSLIATVAAFATLATGGIAYAAMPNGEIPESNYVGSNLSRGQVMSDLESARARGITGTDVDTIDGGAATHAPRMAGAHGPAGSRFADRTREEVRAEREEYWREHGRLPGHDPLYIN